MVIRLLHTRDFTFHEFPNKQTPKVPPYAILSHTWGDDEVSYQSLQDIVREDKMQLVQSMSFSHGLSKIYHCCKQAAEDKYEFAWIDTCCINKLDSAELSDAINSMFRWYKESAVCYAYLADVPATDDFRVEGSAFYNSMWFKRGWTLQELLAPQNVEFYSKDWQNFTTKYDIPDVIADVTGIAEEVLTMPLLYGEGEKAFWRLQQEILKDTTDHTLFAWKGDGYTSGMFARSPADFVPAVDMTTHRRDLQNSASSLTNRVLQIELPLAPTPIPDVYTAVLNCYPWRSEGVDDFYPVALLLRRQFQGRNDFVRVQNNEMIDFRHLKTGSYLDQAAHIDPTYLYVKQVKPIEVTYNMRKVFFAMGRPYRENDISDSTKPYPLLCFSSQTVMGDALRCA
ncbi:hypothetical protein SCUCBS95973_009404 [Sporothrix curviconia]|uniref:Heterokaryon incompatibility domain-containing protein n=1 Tax=Sporothrix curviconia TaxID=1260050 RepID=A0ABP0CUX5_9PEZI